MAICDAVQRGLHSRAYVAGRLSVRREAGEHLFHRLLHADLTAAATAATNASSDAAANNQPRPTASAAD